jgi:hypothetical protein
LNLLEFIFVYIEKLFLFGQATANQKYSMDGLRLIYCGLKYSMDGCNGVMVQVVMLTVLITVITFVRLTSSKAS